MEYSPTSKNWGWDRAEMRLGRREKKENRDKEKGSEDSLRKNKEKGTLLFTSY